METQLSYKGTMKVNIYRCYFREVKYITAQVKNEK